MSDAPRPCDSSDEDLFRRFQRAGDEAAFEALVHRYEPHLFGYLRRYVRSPELAEDVSQATFLQVHLKRGSFAEGRRFRPWLYAIATHQAIDALRRNRRHRHVDLDTRLTGQATGTLAAGFPGREATADDRAETEEACRRVRTALDSLSTHQRLVMELVYDHGLKYREVARRIGIPVGTVKSRVRAAVLKLGAVWQRAGRASHPASPLAARGLAT